MEAVKMLFGGGRDRKAESAAAVQAQAAHMEAQDARRRRVESEQEAALVGRQRDGSTFLANRGTRYSGLKPSLGG